jgi:Flp pilus assembly protein TadG
VSRTDAWCIAPETYHANAALHACRAISSPASARTAARNQADGQTLVEFALIIPVFLLLMLGVVQMIVVGGAALAVNQAAISCARYASLNPSFAQSSVGSYLSITASPLFWF